MNPAKHVYSSILSVLFTAAALLLLATTGCGDDEPSGCLVSSDCPGDQVCTGGQCVDDSGRGCRTADDCEGDETCSADGVCEGPVGTDAGTDTGTDAGTDAARDAGNDAVEETGIEEVFETAPGVASSVPASDGAEDVALDATLTVTFDQPMRATSIPPNVFVEDWRGNRITRTVTYDEPSRTVSLTLEVSGGQVAFEAASPYTLVVNREVRGENGLNMAVDWSLDFTTVGWDLADYEDLAEAYAPRVFAEVRPAESRNRNNRIDWFTKVDFDGDMDVSNNLINAKSSDPLPAHIYWNVLETESHYFIHYTFYYPLGADERSVSYSTAVIHDFAYNLVVVKKSDTDPLGSFVMAEGLGNGQVWGFALDSYPSDSDCGGDSQPDCEGVNIVNGDVMDTIARGDLIGERRFPVYLAEILHASCAATSDGDARIIGANHCDHDVGNATAPFSSDNVNWSRQLDFGDAAEWSVWTEGDAEGAATSTYDMSPFLNVFWANRANPTFFSGDFDYNTPESEGDLVPLPNGMALPGVDRLEGDTTNPGRLGPFWVRLDVARSCTDCSDKGVWFVDPAYVLEGHVTFDHDFSHTYCFNPFRGIDRRGEEGCE